MNDKLLRPCLPILLVAASLLIAACQGTLPPPPSQPVAAVEHLAVLPVEPAADQARRLATGVETVNRLVREATVRMPGVRVLSPDQVESIGTGLYADRRRTALQVGREVGAEAVLTGVVHRFDERQGGEYAIEAPASVDLELELMAVASGQILWSTRITETQTGALENLLTFFSSKRGLRWVTAEELAREGIEERLRECPYLRSPGTEGQ
ncbi:MAG: hypothetical protein AB1634_05990 [Thermodesulfobacteriota bacterium]